MVVVTVVVVATMMIIMAEWMEVCMCSGLELLWDQGYDLLLGRREIEEVLL